jgi:acyl transferase domain-containing protein
LQAIAVEYEVLPFVADEQEALRAAEDLTSALKEGPLSEKNFRTQARRGTFAIPADIPSSPLAFIFTGQGAQYNGMGKELYETFPEIRMWMDRIAAVADFDILNLLFHSTEEDLQKTRWRCQPL